MANKWEEFCIAQIPKMKTRFKQMMGREPDLANPKRFTDKLEWLKAYDSTFLKSMCADKILVREYAEEKLGQDISIPLLGTYDKFDDIDFSKLPKDYVMKTNHGSHTNIIVHNGNINKINARRQFATWLAKDWSWYGYELHYIPIKRKILIEPFMSDGHSDLLDYKFYCFNGNPTFCQIITDRNHNEKISHYNMDWKYEPKYDQTCASSLSNIPRPSHFDKMRNYAELLSADFKFVRVDFYDINDKVYLGELTFIPAAAYLKYKDDKVDYELGDMLKL